MPSDRPYPAPAGHPWAQLRPATTPSPPPSARRRLLLLAAWVLLLGAVVVGFGELGGSRLSPPPLTDVAAWGDWAAARTGPEAAFAVVRIGVRVVAAYLLLATVLAAVAGVWQERRVVSVVEVLTLPVVRRMVHGLIGVSIAGASVAGVGVGMGAGGRSAPTSADVQFASAGRSLRPVPSEVVAAASADLAGPVPVMRLLPDDEPPEDVAAEHLVPTPPVAEPPSADVVASEPSWTVAPGDHVWSVAERVLADARGAVSDVEVARYADALVAANHDRLADATNADLLYPGQVLRLPPVPPGG